MAKSAFLSSKRIVAAIKASDFGSEATRHFADPRFPEFEMDYKLRLAKSIRQAHQLYRAKDSGWPKKMISAIRSNENNLVNWRLKGDFEKWIRLDPTAGKVIDSLLGGTNTLDERLEKFSVSLEKGGIDQIGAQLVLASVLLMSLDISLHPPVRTNVLRDALKYLSLDSSPASGTLAKRYAVFMNILDSLIEISAQGANPMTSRLEAQGAVWCVLSGWMDADKKRGASTRNITVPLENSDPPPRETEKPAIIATRIGQRKYRNGLIATWLGCSVTGCQRYQLLRASHLKPWHASSNEERIDVNNGLLLVPNLDVLLDQHLISFEADGTIMISELLSGSERKILGVQREMKIEVSNSKLSPYLSYHRSKYKMIEAQRMEES